MDPELRIKVKRVHLYNVKKSLSIAKILNRCGQDMAKKYEIYHWKNSMVKSCLIVVICLLKNRVYLVIEEKKPVATFQLKKRGDILFFEKLAVIPEASGKGYGSYCMKLIESRARKLDCKKVQMEVYDKSIHAINFYLNKGYSQVGEISTMKYTDLVMEKNIGN